MPCFKGIAVSVHADGAPLSEHSIQKHSKTGRITTYIPVPQPKISSKNPSGTKPDKSKFAISITLLTPNLPIPYSTPKPTPDNPNPKAQLVAEKDGAKRQGPVIGPYEPVTSSSNETIAAYIYFDGRAKEEVATLLRPGEETWVNSRWVQDTSGGLAEREFLFREVGLERWLNGLDLDKEGQAAKIERRREKLRKRRERQLEKSETESKSGTFVPRKSSTTGQGLLVYGSDIKSPMEEFSEDESSDDDEPPESTGQIKVAMFRVLASGEIKKGEYSPQFDANDDGDAMDAGNDDEADHTTSFAKPKALDPKSISTQTVTGLDGPESPYAVFTFLYRGERQLKKMGILPSGKGKEVASTTGPASRKMDFSNLPPLKSTGTVGFTNFRDTEASSPVQARKKSNGSVKPTNGDDSDEDDDDDIKIDEPEDLDDNKEVKKLLSPEESKFQGELAEGVNRIKLKRQRSSEPESSNARHSPSTLASPTVQSTPSPDLSGQALAPPHFSSSMFSSLSQSLDTSIVGSPLKKHRSSVLGPGGENTGMNANSEINNAATALSLPSTDVLGAAEASRLESKTFEAGNAMEDDDIEL